MCWRWQPAHAQPHGWFMGCCWLQINCCRNRPFASTTLYIQNMMDYSAKSRRAHIWVLSMPSVWWTESACSISVKLWLHNSEHVCPNGLFWIIVIVNHAVNKNKLNWLVFFSFFMLHWHLKRLHLLLSTVLFTSRGTGSRCAAAKPWHHHHTTERSTNNSYFAQVLFLHCCCGPNQLWVYKLNDRSSTGTWSSPWSFNVNHWRLKMSQGCFKHKLNKDREQLNQML